MRKRVLVIKGINYDDVSYGLNEILNLDLDPLILRHQLLSRSIKKYYNNLNPYFRCKRVKFVYGYYELIRFHIIIDTVLLQVDIRPDCIMIIGKDTKDRTHSQVKNFVDFVQKDLLTSVSVNLHRYGSTYCTPRKRKEPYD